VATNARENKNMASKAAERKNAVRMNSIWKEVIKAVNAQGLAFRKLAMWETSSIDGIMDYAQVAVDAKNETTEQDYQATIQFHFIWTNEYTAPVINFWIKEGK
jgi:hypothetical protein